MAMIVLVLSKFFVHEADVSVYGMFLFEELLNHLLTFRGKRGILFLVAVKNWSP